MLNRKISLCRRFSSKIVFMFPGQGSQYIGMGSSIIKEYPSLQRYYDIASDILGYNLQNICENGPKEKLDSTEIAQVAIFVSSMIALEKLKLTEPNIVENCSVALGLSLGEYSALCFAGCLTYEDGVKLTSIRGKAMQYASNIIPSGMISIVGLSQEIIEKLCYETSTHLQQDIQIGNYLTENNFTISGSIETLNYFIKLINKSNYHPNKLLFLSVSGAFHSSYMRPALPLLQTELLNTTILPSNISIISNTLGRPYESIEEIRNELIKQVIEPVQWKKSMDYILHPDNQFEIAYEIGPGRVCTGILKNISRRAKVINILA